MDMGMPSAVKLSFKLFQLIGQPVIYLVLDFDKNSKKGTLIVLVNLLITMLGNRLIHNNDVNSISIETDGK